MRKVIIYLIISFHFIGCSSAFTTYKKLNNNIPTDNKLYKERKKIIKPILTEENNDIILIILWHNNSVDSKAILFDALIYSYDNEEVKLMENSNKNPYEFKIRKQIETNGNKSLNFILQKYLSGEEEYLLNIISTFSSSSVNFPYYVYDFRKKKKLEVQAFILSDDGTRVKGLFEDDGFDPPTFDYE